MCSLDSAYAEVAGALNLRPVSKILVTVGAQERLETVLSPVRRYNNRLQEAVPESAIGLLLTHMDKVTWDKAKIARPLRQEDKVTDVVCAG